MAHSNPSLGTLFKIPSEDRNIIWSVLVLPDGREQRWVDDDNSAQLSFSKEGTLAILRTSRQLYNEALDIIQKSQTLTFQVGCNPFVIEERNWNRSFSLENSQGRKWLINNTANTYEPDDILRFGLRNFPYTKIGKVKIEIPCPSTNGPSQMIYVWRNIADVVSLLSPVRGIKNLEIKFINSDSGNWLTNNIPQLSLHPPGLPKRWCRSDVGLMLL